VRPDLGATCRGDGRCRFRVWAPRAERIEVRISEPHVRIEPLVRDADGYHEAVLEGVAPGSRYVYRIDGAVERPDPASRWQPDGVHAPSAVVNADGFGWSDADWRGRPLREYVFYELHPGTFTPEGTFEAIIPHLDELVRTGITSVEITPVAQCPGTRNWGYDGAYPWAVSSNYGGPDGLKRLVDACHARGLAVTLDVVYNHLGPEGNYLGDYGPYFAHQYKTPWGPAINFDGPHSDHVRNYFIQNALHWMYEYHVDAFRLDAIQGIIDVSARPFLAELNDTVRKAAATLGRPVHVIAESDLNDVKVVTPEDRGGLGHDAQWNDDLHHALHAYLTGEHGGYYMDFGSLDDLKRAYAEGFVVGGGYSRYRQRRFGNSARSIAPEKFVVYAQNHDQTGNRRLGERLSTLVSFEALKLLAGAVCLSPYLPMLFMGEEYGETAPFRYFVDHGDPDLVEAVRKGRADDFRSFGWEGHVPDPQDYGTFRASVLNHALKAGGQHRILNALYTEILAFRRRRANVFPAASRDDVAVAGSEASPAFSVLMGHGAAAVLLAMNFGNAPEPVPVPARSGGWNLRIDSAAKRWNGASRLPDRVEAGTAETMEPLSFAVFERSGGS